MNIIIPMTGYGSRFVSAGYKELKPLIKVYGHPILKWIVDGIYPGKENIIFVCRKEHLDTIEGMREQLKEIAPSATIYEIKDWVKKGPVYDVMMAESVIPNDEPCIINYCDFFMEWNWPVMKKKILNSGCDGCIPCYTGFHPHLIPIENVYASCLTDDNDNLIEIREKYSFEIDKTRAKHSPGNYYFKSGNLLKKYSQKLIDSGKTINGEYYASMIYNFMVDDGLRIWVPTDINYFCQWGTPEDLREFEYWIDKMKGIYE